MRAYDKLHEGTPLTAWEAHRLKDPALLTCQHASLAALLYYRASTSHEADLMEWVLSRYPSVQTYLVRLFPDDPQLPKVECDKIFGETDPRLCDILRRTAQRKELGYPDIKYLVDAFVGGTVGVEVMSIWLMLVCCVGLSNSDALSLTNAMSDSGSTYDYRRHPALGQRRLIRRYPTGGLSEKTALILPSLIGTFGREYPVASPFLVARSLGFTGGTWDKLMSIPGFSFPHPGDEALDILRECHCAMIVTKDDCNPADRLMYQMRSITGTVHSKALAAASIASKQVALPVDRLLLDVRFGSGAFFEKREAEELGALIQRLMEHHHISCEVVLTEMSQPNGMAIGNALEVCEAVAIMANQSAVWDIRALNEQKRLVIDFFAKLMAAEFPFKTHQDWVQEAERKIREGALLAAFKKMLIAHRVDPQVAEEIVLDPLVLTPATVHTVDVRTERRGVLSAIDQKTLGYIVNFRLVAGSNAYCPNLDYAAGVVLKKRLGDEVQKGETLCRIYPGTHPERVTDEITTGVANCFTIAGE